MEPCLLCDFNAVPRASGDAPICALHRDRAWAAFELAEPAMRAHLEKLYGTELDEWVRQGVLPGLVWHLHVREHPPEPTRELPWWRPGRRLQFARDPEAVVRRLRELVTATLMEESLQRETNAVLQVGSPDERCTASFSAAVNRDALSRLVSELITVDTLKSALRSMSLEDATRAVVDAYLTNDNDADLVVQTLDVLSRGAQSLADIRRVPLADPYLVDPVEVAQQAELGLVEFVHGWWDLRAELAEPARQWIELLEGRFPRARNAGDQRDAGQ